MQKQLKRMLLYGAVAMGSVMVGMTSCSDDDKENGGAVENGHRKWVSKVGGVNRYAVQLWKGGPFWAEFNVGTTIDTYEGKSIPSSGSAYTDTTSVLGCYYCWGRTYDCKQTNDYSFSGSTTSIAGIDSLDVATANWGDSWRMPDNYELSGLEPKNGRVDTFWCDGSTKKFAGSSIPGMMFRGKGDYAKDSIFFPAASICNGGSFSNVGVYGGYWSSVPYGDGSACRLYFGDGCAYMGDGGRGYGRSVRAVCSK